MTLYMYLSMWYDIIYVCVHVGCVGVHVVCVGFYVVCVVSMWYVYVMCARNLCVVVCLFNSTIGRVCYTLCVVVSNDYTFL